MFIIFVLQVGGSVDSVETLKRVCWPACTACMGSTSTNSINCRKKFVYGGVAGLACLYRQQPIQLLTRRSVDRGFGGQDQKIRKDIRCLLPSLKKKRLSCRNVDESDLTSFFEKILGWWLHGFFFVLWLREIIFDLGSMKSEVESESSSVVKVELYIVDWR